MAAYIVNNDEEMAPDVNEEVSHDLVAGRSRGTGPRTSSTRSSSAWEPGLPLSSMSSAAATPPFGFPQFFNRPQLWRRRLRRAPPAQHHRLMTGCR